MPPSSEIISGIRDNHSRGSVGDFLRQQLKAGADLDLVTAYFTVLKCPRKAQREVGSLVRDILAAKRADPGADTIALEREIDRHVYALYGLTPDEIKLVEGSSGPTSS